MKPPVLQNGPVPIVEPCKSGTTESTSNGFGGIGSIDGRRNVPKNVFTFWIFIFFDKFCVLSHWKAAVQHSKPRRTACCCLFKEALPAHLHMYVGAHTLVDTKRWKLLSHHFSMANWVLWHAQNAHKLSSAIEMSPMKWKCITMQMRSKIQLARIDKGA